MDERLIVVLGPTATGKTELGIRLAEEFNGEIVSADSRQVYRFMDIGSAKPTAEQRDRAPHHLIDILYPDQEFGLAEFLRLSRQRIDSIRSKGRLPIVVGGTGQYIWALVENWKVPRVPPNPELRRELEELVAKQGAEALHKLLEREDPASAQRIDPRNTRRVIRALEIHHSVGVIGAQGERKQPVSDEALVLGLTADRKLLYRMIDGRVDRMIDDGLAAEAANLVRRGYSWDLPSMSAWATRRWAHIWPGRCPWKHRSHASRPGHTGSPGSNTTGSASTTRAYIGWTWGLLMTLRLSRSIGLEVTLKLWAKRCSW